LKHVTGIALLAFSALAMWGLRLIAKAGNYLADAAVGSFKDVTEASDIHFQGRL
jgi:hypothetical protein